MVTPQGQVVAYAAQTSSSVSDWWTGGGRQATLTVYRRRFEERTHPRALLFTFPRSVVRGELMGDVSKPRGRKRMRNQECSNFRNNVRQIPRIVCNAFDESTPLPLLLLVPARSHKSKPKRLSAMLNCIL